MPVREISRRTRLSRNTIRKYLRADIEEPNLRTATRPNGVNLLSIMASIFANPFGTG